MNLITRFGWLRETIIRETICSSCISCLMPIHHNHPKRNESLIRNCFFFISWMAAILLEGGSNNLLIRRLPINFPFLMPQQHNSSSSLHLLLRFMELKITSWCCSSSFLHLIWLTYMTLVSCRWWPANNVSGKKNVGEREEEERGNNKIHGA